MKSETGMLSLAELWNEIWAFLGRGSAFSKDPWHTPQLCTLTESGPASRIVILRKADKGKHVLICHTDIRSQKVKEIRNDEQISWLFWNPKSRTQLRISAQATIHHQNEVASQAWESLSPSSRTNYSLQATPGDRLSQGVDGLVSFTRELEPSEGVLQAWYQRFAVIETSVRQMEWLELSRDGHRRARFTVQENGLDMTWLVP